MNEVEWFLHTSVQRMSFLIEDVIKLCKKIEHIRRSNQTCIPMSNFSSVYIQKFAKITFTQKALLLMHRMLTEQVLTRHNFTTVLFFEILNKY